MATPTNGGNPESSRRALLKGVSLGMAGLCAGCGQPEEEDGPPPIVLVTHDTATPSGLPSTTEGTPEDPGPHLNIGFPEELQEVGAQLAVFADLYGRIRVARVSETTFIAVSDVCSHQGCPLKYQPESEDLFCTCHGSIFLTDGTVTVGPAKTDIAAYDTSFDGSNIRIHLQPHPA